MSASPKRIDPSIIAAFIGVCGTLAVALISIFAPKLFPQSTLPVVLTSTTAPTSTNVPTPLPTTTVPVGASTSTPAPATPTPEPTFTPVTLAIGQDWANGCISSVLWTPYTPGIQPDPINGCFVQPFANFYTSGGRLAFTFVERVGSAQIYGLFAQLPSDGTVSLSVLLTEVDNGEVLMGIFAEPDINSSGMLLVFPSGNNVKRQKVILKTMPNANIFSQTEKPLEANPPIYDAFLDFNGGTVQVKVMKNQVDLGSIPVISANKWLFLGYQVLNGSNRLQAEFFSPIIAPR